MRENTKRTSYGVAVLIASIALMTPIRAQEPAQRGPSEGIKVHGHWTITVRNPDGTVASKTEVENALQAGGAQGLMYILSRQWTPGLWRVILQGRQQTTNLIVFEGTSGVRSLEVTQGSAAAPAVVLTGYGPWPSLPSTPDQIQTVTSTLFLCEGTVAPEACRSIAATQGSLIEFSGTTLTTVPPITVTPGQIVQFTVVFTFS